MLGRSETEKFVAVLMLSCIGLGIGTWIGYELPRHVMAFIVGMYVGAHLAWVLSPTEN